MSAVYWIDVSWGYACAWCFSRLMNGLPRAHDSLLPLLHPNPNRNQQVWPMECQPQSKDLVAR